MLRLVQTNQLLVPPVLLLYAILLRLLSFWDSFQAPEPTHAPFFQQLLLPGLQQVGIPTAVVALALVLLQAFFLNAIVNRYKLLGSTQYTVAMLYLLIASALPEFLVLSPALIANTFLLIALSEIFKWYRAHQAAPQLFNVGFWLSVGSLCYFPVVSYYLLAIVALISLRNFKLQEWLILSIGFLVPYFWMGTYAFWVDAWPALFNNYLGDNVVWLDWHWSQIPHLPFKTILLAGLSLWVVLSASQHFYKTSIQQQKNLNVFFWALFIGALGLFYQRAVGMDFFIYLSIPLALFLALNLHKIRRRWIAEVIHLLLFLTIIGFQYKDEILHFLVLR